ncbi:MAG: hypothetical protein ACK5GN_04100 [Pseudomonadota bacterium]
MNTLVGVLSSMNKLAGGTFNAAAGGRWCRVTFRPLVLAADAGLLFMNTLVGVLSSMNKLAGGTFRCNSV